MMTTCKGERDPCSLRLSSELGSTGIDIAESEEEAIPACAINWVSWISDLCKSWVMHLWSLPRLESSTVINSKFFMTTLFFYQVHYTSMYWFRINSYLGHICRLRAVLFDPYKWLFIYYSFIYFLLFIDLCILCLGRMQSGLPWSLQRMDTFF